MAHSRRLLSSGTRNNKHLTMKCLRICLIALAILVIAYIKLISSVKRLNLKQNTRLMEYAIPKPTQKETSKTTKKPPPPLRPKSDFAKCRLLAPTDTIYKYGNWDGAPIVLESHKLLFFTVPKVGCTVFKQLFRRIMGYQDWRDDAHPLPHAPPRNGLTYLYEYDPAVADSMLTDPEWTKAIFVRDPKERLLSAYLDKGVQNKYLQFHCCEANRHRGALYTKLKCGQFDPHSFGGPNAARKDVGETPLFTFSEFLGDLYPHCDDPHWHPQHDRVDDKYWQHITFVGHMDSIYADTKRLLNKIHAWEDYGANGWPGGEIFRAAAKDTVSHATDSVQKLKEYYTPRAEQLADAITDKDYNISTLKFVRRRISEE
jgi:hypothetical protein